MIEKKVTEFPLDFYKPMPLLLILFWFQALL